MRGDILLHEMKSYNPSFNLNEKMNIPTLNCENIQAFTLNIPKEIKNVLNNKLYDLSIQLENNLKDFSNLVKSLWENLKNTCIELYEIINNTYKDIIKNFQGNYQYLCNSWKKLKSSRISDIDFKNIINNLSDDIKEMLSLYILVDIIETVWDIIKDIWGSAKNHVNHVLTYFKQIRDIFKNENTNNSVKLVTFLSTIIPILAQLITTVLCIIELSKKEKDDDISNNIFENTELVIPNKVKNDKYYDNSHLIKYLQKYGNIPDSYKEIFKDKLNVCPVYEIDNEVFLQDKKGYIIEISLEISDFKFIKQVNDIVNYNDIIGYIENIPIYSEVDGIVSDVTDRYIIIFMNENNTNENGLNSIYSNISNSANETDKEFENIYNKYVNNLYIDEVIRDYYFKCIKSIYLADYSGVSKSANYKRVNDYYEYVYEKYEKYTENHDDNIKDLCDPDKIQSKSEKDFIKIKDDLYDIKRKYKNNLFNLIKTTDYSRSYKKSISRDDYCLFDYYLDFLMSIENYNKENKILTKFLDLITSFMNKRYFLEDISISKLISKFNNIALSYHKSNYFNFINYNINDYSYKTVNEFINNDFIDIIDEDKLKIISQLTILFVLIKNIQITNNINSNYVYSTYNGTLSELRNLTKNERSELLKFLNYLKDEYTEFEDIEKEVNNYNKKVNWPSQRYIFVNNIKYIHYLFQKDILNNSLDKINLSDKIFNENEISLEDIEIDDYRYWLKYCMLATLMNCVNPLYWSTGIILPMIGPLILPIILIPIKFIKGKCSCLIGLGICGIAIYPFMLYINMSIDTMTYIIFINMLIDQLIKMIDSIKELSKDGIKAIINPMIKTLDEKIKTLDDDIKLLEDEILTIKSIE